MDERRRWRLLILLMTMCGLVLGIVGLPTGETPPAADRFVLLDLSRSHGLDAGALLDEALRRWPLQSGSPDDRLAFLAFGEGTLLLVPPGPRSAWDDALPEARLRVTTLADEFRQGSRLDLALASVKGLATGNRPVHVLLLGDGRYDRKSFRDGRAWLQERGGTLRMEGPLLRADEDVRLSLAGPVPRLAPDRFARIDVRVDGPIRSPRRVLIRSGAEEVTVRLLPSRGAQLSIGVTPGPAAREIEIAIADPGGDDAYTGNNRLQLPVSVPGQRSVGILGSSAAEVGRLLESERYRVVGIGASQSLDARTLGNLDALLLADAAMGEGGLDENSARDLAQAVSQEGLGLVVTGGAHAFAAGGYGPSSLDELLPLSSRPGAPRRVTVLLDRSGSMEQERRLQRAVEAVVRLCAGLTPEDRFQVISFAAAPDQPLPASPAAPARFLGEPVASLRQLRASGPTRISPAVSAALAGMGRNEADELRVLIVLSDFRDQGLDGTSAALCKSLQELEVETVAVLLDPEPETEARTASLGARLVRAARITPDLLLEALSVRGWVEEAVRVRWSSGARPRPTGSLRAWNPVRKGDGARVWLESDAGAALGADARRGAGFVTAFAADALLEDWTRALLPDLVASVLPPGGEMACWWSGPDLQFRVPDALGTGPFFVTVAGRVRAAQERSPGVFQVPGVCGTSGAGPLLLSGPGGQLLGRLLPPVGLDPEWAAEPISGGGTRTAEAAHEGRGSRLRWPFLLVALALLVVLGGTRPTAR